MSQALLETSCLKPVARILLSTIKSTIEAHHNETALAWSEYNNTRDGRGLVKC